MSKWTMKVDNCRLHKLPQSYPGNSLRCRRWRKRSHWTSPRWSSWHCSKESCQPGTAVQREEKSAWRVVWEWFHWVDCCWDICSGGYQLLIINISNRRKRLTIPLKKRVGQVEWEGFHWAEGFPERICSQDCFVARSVVEQRRGSLTWTGTRQDFRSEWESAHWTECRINICSILFIVLLGCRTKKCDWFTNPAMNRAGQAEWEGFQWTGFPKNIYS